MSESNLDNIINSLSALTVLEAAELVGKLEEKWGVSAAAPAAVAVAAGGAAEAAPAKDSFSVVLTGAGSSKLNVIKVVRQINPDLNLKEAKELVESAPKVLREDISDSDAKELKQKIEEAGGTADIK